jgi:uncharacterized protein YaiE (UPF0345 family)
MRTAILKPLGLEAEVLFNGGVVRYTATPSRGPKITFGTIRPGRYTLRSNTEDVVEVVSGECKVMFPGGVFWIDIPTDEGNNEFEVSAHSSFDIRVDKGIVQFIWRHGK